MNSADRRSPELLRLYFQFLEHQRSADFIQAVVSRYTPAALERLTAADDRSTRRAAVLALGLTADYTANAVLGRALGDEDRAVRMLAENGLRAVWRRQGSPGQRQAVERLMRLNRSGDHARAADAARTLLRLAPWIAEAWHQKAMAHFHEGRHYTALADFAQTVELNPYHFDAAAGMAYCHLQLENMVAALECVQQTLRLNPNLEGLRALMNRLQREVDRHS